MKKQRITILTIILIVITSVSLSWAVGQGKSIVPVLSLLLKNKIAVPHTGLNEVVKLIAVSSGNSDALTVNWFPAQDDNTPHSEMQYTAHISTDEDFKPSTITAKSTVKGKTTMTVTGLQSNTRYCVLITATNSAGSVSWSNRLTARTVSTTAKRTTAVLIEQEASQNPVATPNSVTYLSDDEPSVGEYLVSGIGNGYLRKVTAATSSNGLVVAQTESASLNELLERYEISTTIKIAKVPASSGVTKMMKTAAGTIPVQSFAWPESSLTLLDANQDLKNGKVVSTATGKLIQAKAAPRMDESLTGKYINITYPKYLSASPGSTLQDSIEVKLKNDPKSQNREICKIVLEEFTHKDPELSKLARPSFEEHIRSDKKTGSLELSFSPTKDYIDSKNRPYFAYAMIYVDEQGEGCNGDERWKTWDEVQEVEIPIYIHQGQWELFQDEAEVKFSGDFSVTNTAEIIFEPELNIDVQTSDWLKKLESADFVVKANINLSNTLTINASAEGELVETVPLLEERKFVRVFLVGQVPVVVRGAFSIDARIEGHIGGAATLTKFMELSFPDTEFGVRYKDGVWTKVEHFTPEYTFTIDGEADADAEITLTLIPDLQIHFYEAASGRMILEPSLYAETALHGQFKYQDENGDALSDLDYWFPYLNAGVALDMGLYAGLHILDYNIASWPEDVSYEEIDKFNPFHLITKEEGKLYALPTLTSTVDYSPNNPPDSRALLITGESTNYITPRLNSDLNPFRQWTEAKVISAQDFALTPLNETLSQHWFIPKQAGDFTVRLGGYSKIGWFVRQVADDLVLSLPDDDNNGLPNYWEARFDLANAADDNDGLSNQEEFNHGTDPTKYDSDGDGVSDGQEVLDGADPLDGNDNLANTTTLTLTGATVTEGDSGTKNLTFTLSLNQYRESATVDYTTQDVTATVVDNDYTASTGTVIFIGGSTSETISIIIQGDANIETDELFFLVLSNPVNLSLVNTTVAGIIQDDDHPATSPLNDTGITWGGDSPSGNNTDCTGVEIGAQDCSHGRDVTHNDDSDGHAGFSFTKLDSGGVPLANQNVEYATTPWACVKDNVTGLIWEVKTDDNGLHDKDDSYNWYNTDSTTNGGADGYADNDGNICHGYDSGDSSTFCNTQAYTARVNAAGWCGATDWRMPTIFELQGIVSYGRHRPSIDTNYFPNTLGSSVWSGSPNAHYSYYAWNVNFYYGGSYSNNRYDFSYQVRLVRGGQ